MPGEGSSGRSSHWGCKGRCPERLRAPGSSSDGGARSNDGGCLQIRSGSIHRTGEPQTLLQEFRNWKGKWLLAERKLLDSTHVMDEVLQTQLLNALSGEARDMVSALPAGSFDKAMKQPSLGTVSGLQPPTYQLQEARLEPRRSRSFQQRQPWLGTWNSCFRSSKHKI